MPNNIDPNSVVWDKTPQVSGPDPNNIVWDNEQPKKGFNLYGTLSSYAQKGIKGLGKAIGSKTLEDVGTDWEKFSETHPDFSGQANQAFRKVAGEYADIPSKFMKGLSWGYADSEAVDTPKTAGLGHKVLAQGSQLLGMGLGLAPISKGLQAFGLVPKAAGLIGGALRGLEIGGLYGFGRKPEQPGLNELMVNPNAKGETRMGNALKDAAMFGAFEGAGGLIEALATKMSPTVKLVFDKLKADLPLNSYEKSIYNRFGYGRSAALGMGAGATEPAENWQERMMNILTGGGAFGVAHGVQSLAGRALSAKVKPSKESGIDQGVNVDEHLKSEVNKPQPGGLHEGERTQENQGIQAEQAVRPPSGERADDGRQKGYGNDEGQGLPATEKVVLPIPEMRVGQQFNSPHGVVTITDTSDPYAVSFRTSTGRVVTEERQRLGDFTPLGREPGGIADMPEGWTVEVGRLGQGRDAAVDWQNRRIVVSSRDKMANPDILNREIARIRVETLPESLSSQEGLFADYAKVKGLDDWAVGNRLHHDLLAEDYGDYLTQPDAVRPELRSLFEKYFPEQPAEPAIAKPTIGRSEAEELKQLGYGQAEISQMTPEKAREIIATGKAPGIEEPPPGVGPINALRQGKEDTTSTMNALRINEPSEPMPKEVQPLAVPENTIAQETKAPNLLTPNEQPQQAAATQERTFAPPSIQELKQATKDLKESKPVKDIGKILSYVLYPEHGASEASRIATYRYKGQVDKLVTTLELRMGKLADKIRLSPVDEVVDYLDKTRTGRTNELTGHWREYFDVMDPLANHVWDMVVDLNPEMEQYRKDAHALTTLQWVKDGAENFEGKLFDPRSLAGTKDFLKKRSSLTASELIDAGYKLKSADLVRINFRTLINEANYVHMGRLIQEAIDTGRWVWRPERGPIPKGYDRLVDPISDTYGFILAPKSVSMEEYVDTNVFTGLSRVARALGVNVERKVNTGMGPGVLGYAARDGSETVAKRNTELSVMGHEIGHQIDNKFKLWDLIVNKAEGMGKRGKVTQAASDEARALIKKELRELADLTGRSHAYSHSRPEQIAQMVEAYVHFPEYMKEVAPRVYEAFNEFVNKTPEMEGMRNLHQGFKMTALPYDVPVPKPVYVKAYNVLDEKGNIIQSFPKRVQAENNMERLGGVRIGLQVGVPKTIKTGEWLAPEAEARMLNNRVSRDAIRTGTFGVVGRPLMALKNFTTGIELISGFHYATIAQESVTSRLGLGIQQMLRGDMEGLQRTLKGGWGIAEKAKAYLKDPEGWLHDPANKDLMIKQYGPDAPRMGEIINTYFNSGLLLTQDRSLRWGQDKKLERLEKWAGSNLNEKGQKLVAGVMIPAKTLRFIAKDLLFERIIPNAKFSNFVMQYTYNLKQYKGLIKRGEISKEELAFRAARLVENKFGEMNWDNFWMNRTMKTALQLMFRSFTWQYGTWRGFGTAISRVPEQIRFAKNAIAHGERPPIDPDIAWVVSLFATHVMEAALLGYGAALVTGNPDLKPKTWFDFIYPKIGLMTRVAIPGYVKEPISLWQDIKKSDFGIPVDMVRSKMSGFLGKFADIARNKDFYGTQVYDPDSNYAKKLWDVSRHMVPLPFSVTSYQREKEEGGGLGMGVLSGMGIQKAPHWIEDSEAITTMKRYVGASQAVGGSSEEDFKTRQLKNQVTNALRQGKDYDALPQDMRDKLEKIPDVKLKRWFDDATKTPLQAGFPHVNKINQAVNVWNKMTPEEKNDTADTMMKHIERALKNAENDPEKQERLMNRLQPIIDEIGSAPDIAQPAAAQQPPEQQQSESDFLNMPPEERIIYRDTARGDEEGTE